jgi:Immunity protein 27
MIRPEEIELIGRWETVNGVVCADAAAKRILELARTYLTKVAVSEAFGGWETLYQDPADLRFWELTYPHGEMHGGGPPKLKSLTVQEAKSKYRV